MKQKLLFILCLLISKLLFSQTIHRVEVNGFILANANDVEAVAVYNKSSNKGTITNENGQFVLEVAEHDVIEISALQFESQKISITKDVIESGILKIYLVEQVNQLSAVLLKQGLSGNLAVDISDVKIPPKVEINLGNMNALELYDEIGFSDYKVYRDLKTLTSKGELYNGFNPLALAGMLFKPKKRHYKSDKPNFEKPKILLEVYSTKHISETFNIPLEHIEEFIVFVENNGISQQLLEDEKEFELIDFLVKQSELFLKQ